MYLLVRFGPFLYKHTHRSFVQARVPHSQSKKKWTKESSTTTLGINWSKTKAVLHACDKTIQQFPFLFVFFFFCILLSSHRARCRHSIVHSAINESLDRARYSQLIEFSFLFYFLHTYFMLLLCAFLYVLTSIFYMNPYILLLYSTYIH